MAVKKENEVKEKNVVKKTTGKKEVTKKAVSKGKTLQKNKTKSTPVKKTTPVKKDLAKKVTKIEDKEVENKDLFAEATNKAKKVVKAKKDEQSIIEPEKADEVVSVNNKESKKEKVKECKNDKTKCLLITIIILLIVAIASFIIYFFVIKDNNGLTKKSNNNYAKLPKPELDDGQRGELGIDKNINEKVIDKYLGRDDAVYRDMRMLEDPGDYEAIGGDRYLSGYVKGFEVVPLPYIIPVKNLPKEVGYTYSGYTLFLKMSDGTYAPMYKESMKIVEELFPKDKIIFLMCGGGGYAGMMKEFLVANGWNKDKIYVVGGYWYYKGKNNIEVPKKTTSYGVEYDFSNVPYHDIEFDTLTPIVKDRHNKGEITKFYLDDEYYEKNDEKFDKLYDEFTNFYTNFFKDNGVEVDLGEALDVTADDEDNVADEKYDEAYKAKEQELVDYVNNLLKNKKSFVISAYSDFGCGDPTDSVAYRSKDYAKENNVYFYLVPSTIIMESDLARYINYFPNVIIVKDGDVYTYLDGSSDDDAKIFDSKKALVNWINKYIYIKK